MIHLSFAVSLCRDRSVAPLHAASGLEHFQSIRPAFRRFTIFAGAFAFLGMKHRIVSLLDLAGADCQTQDDPVKLDPSLVEFRPSPIHGLGGFAKATVPARTRIIEYVGERIDKRQSTEHCSRNNQCLFYLDEQWDLNGNVEWNPARLLNHSCQPNCDAERNDGRIWIVARRDIAAGEEITFNYGYDLESYREHPCCCGAMNCVGFIIAEEWFDLVRSQRHAVRE
jgi:hypothetical protein